LDIIPKHSESQFIFSVEMGYLSFEHQLLVLRQEFSDKKLDFLLFGFQAPKDVLKVEPG
jgi:hypothetical protein